MNNVYKQKWCKIKSKLVEIKQRRRSRPIGFVTWSFTTSYCQSSVKTLAINQMHVSRVMQVFTNLKCLWLIIRPKSFDDWMSCKQEDKGEKKNRRSAHVCKHAKCAKVHLCQHISRAMNKHPQTSTVYLFKFTTHTPSSREKTKTTKNKWYAT